MQKAVNFILTLMSPTPSPPSCLHPQPHHLPHAHYHCLLDYWKLNNWKRMWFEIICFKTRGSDWFWNLNWFYTGTTKYFSTKLMHHCLHMVTNNLALYQFLTLHYDGKIEGNKYLHFDMLWTLHHVQKLCMNKTIFQRMCNETFWSTFNHKVWNV